MLDYMRIWVEALRRKDEGQALVEYALILFLVSIASIAILGTLGGVIADVFADVVAAL